MSAVPAAVEVCPHGLVRCARCGHTCAVDTWRRQPVVRTLTSADLAGRVSVWPDDEVVEVRGCPGCGTAIARRRRAT